MSSILTLPFCPPPPFALQFSTPNAVRDFSGLVQIMGAKVVPLDKLLRLAETARTTHNCYVIADNSTFDTSLATDADFARAHEKGLLLDFWWIVDMATDQVKHDPGDSVYAVPGDDTQSQA